MVQSRTFSMEGNGDRVHDAGMLQNASGNERISHLPYFFLWLCEEESIQPTLTAGSKGVWEQVSLIQYLK